MRKSYLIIGFAIAALGSATAPVPEDPQVIVVSVAAIDEVRSFSSLTQPALGRGSFDYGSIWLKLEGSALRDATTYVNLRIDQAVDEHGNDLIKPYDTRSTPLERPVSFLELAADKPPAIQIGIPLPNTPRATRSIAHLRGQLEIRVGSDLVTVTFSKLKTNLNRSVSDPTLAALGDLDPKIFRLGDQRLGNDTANAVGFYATAAAVMLANVEVIDSDGSVIGRARPSHDVPEAGFQANVQLPRVVDDTMSLRVNLYRKTTLIKVPFDLKDIALP